MAGVGAAVTQAQGRLILALICLAKKGRQLQISITGWMCVRQKVNPSLFPVAV